jgi:hypothetical protein
MDEDYTAGSNGRVETEAYEERERRRQEIKQEMRKLAAREQERSGSKPSARTIYAWSILTRREVPFRRTIACDLEIARLPNLTGGFLTATLHHPRQGTLPRAVFRAMRILHLCPHSNVGWPIRCDGEEGPSQHCFDCGAQRTYVLQPVMQRGPWRRPQRYSACRPEIAFTSSTRTGSSPAEHLMMS